MLSISLSGAMTSISSVSYTHLAQIFYGQSAENIIPGIDLVVYTAAIHPDNPEFAEARSQGLPMLSRAELLGQIMDNYNNSVAVAGTQDVYKRQG